VFLQSWLVLACTLKDLLLTCSLIFGAISEPESYCFQPFFCIDMDLPSENSCWSFWEPFPVLRVPSIYLVQVTSFCFLQQNWSSGPLSCLCH
jgi:hypothetical protein